MDPSPWPGEMRNAGGDQRKRNGQLGAMKLQEPWLMPEQENKCSSTKIACQSVHHPLPALVFNSTIPLGWPLPFPPQEKHLVSVLFPVTITHSI